MKIILPPTRKGRFCVQIEATDAFYIKLGRSGEREAEALRDGTIRFGYREAPHELCEQGAWQDIWHIWKADNASLRDDAARFAEANLYERMFFVWHTGTITADEEAADITLIDSERLARLVLDAGLSSWLREKVS